MLLIDIGNSCLKWAVADKNAYLSRAVLPYSLTDLRQICAETFADLQHQPDIYISCVAGEAIKQIVAEWFQEHWQVKPVFVRSQHECLGLVNAYREAEKLGVDRWCAMLGAWQKYQRGFCIIDCGTAVTVDVVDNSGKHLGGLIMPGLNIMMAALKKDAQGIGIIKGELCNLADNTGDAVVSGCYQVLAAGLEKLVTEYRSRFGEKFLCIVTGGDGKHIAAKFGFDYNHEPDLVLDGLKTIIISGKSK